MLFEMKRIPDNEYFAEGDIFRELDPFEAGDNLVVSNSLLKNIRKYNLFHLLTNGMPKVDEDLQAIFDVGSAFHCFVLEPKEFTIRYYISDTPDPTEDRVRVSEDEYKWVETVAKNIRKKYPEMTDGKFTEIAIFGKIDGVKVKCKIDKLLVTYNKDRSYAKIEIVDLKSTWFDPFKQKRDIGGERKKLRWMLSDIDYDLQAYFYTRIVSEWAYELGASCEVDFSLLVASKESDVVQKFKVGSEMMETGRLKFESVWGDVVDFVRHGKSRLSREEIL